jgi:hypothetical protein
MLSRIWLLPVALGALGCSSGETAGPAPGGMDVSWTGADTGKLSAPAVAEWCDSLRLLELRAIKGDTGIALLFYPADSAVAPGEFRMVSPHEANERRPSAALALRWFAETSIRGFRAESGSVSLERLGASGAAGKFTGHLRSATEGSRLTITGSFHGLTVTPAPGECAGTPEPEDDGSELRDEEDEEEGGEEEEPIATDTM